MSNLNNKIFSLIEMKREGSYWDYKEKYHSNNAKFIHDIICLANNLDNKDAYLIFGVSDNGEVKGIAGDENRKNQADIIDLLRNQKFAGRIPPFVKLETILYESEMVVMDSGRYITSTPKLEVLDLDIEQHSAPNFLSYNYYTRDSIEWDIYKFLFDSDNHEAGISNRRFLEVILIFDNEYEKEEFNRYLRENLSPMDIEFIQNLQIINNDERMYEIAKHEIVVSKFFNRKLQEYRHNLDIKN